MIELHLIGYTAELGHLVLDLAGSEGGRYRLVVDPDLFATLDELREERRGAGLQVGDLVEFADDLGLDREELRALQEADAAAAAAAGHVSVGSAQGADLVARADEGRWDEPAPSAPSEPSDDLFAEDLDEEEVLAPVEDEPWDADSVWAPPDGEDEPGLEELQPEAIDPDVDVDDEPVDDEPVDDVHDEPADDVDDEPADEPADEPVVTTPTARGGRPVSRPAGSAIRVVDSDEAARVRAANGPPPEPAEPAEPPEAAEAPEPAPAEGEIAAYLDRRSRSDDTASPPPWSRSVTEEPPSAAAVEAAAPQEPPSLPVGTARDRDGRTPPRSLVPEARPRIDATTASSPSRASRPARRSGTEPVDARLSPAQIQARLRAGASVRQVAKEADTPVEWIERWETPILDERARILDQVRAMRLERPRLGKSRDPIGAAVAANLRARHVAADDVSWSASRRRDGRWSVSVTYPYRGRKRTATWILDVEGDEVRAASDNARDLGYTRRKR